METKKCIKCGKIKSPADFARRSNRPIGRKPVCKKCSNKDTSKWRNANRKRISDYNKTIYYKDSNAARNRVKNYYVRRRIEIVTHYGGKCVCCGETIYEFLCFDHVNNDGKHHRQKIGRLIEKWIIDNNYPNSIQLLCYNCNMGKTKNKEHICPHKTRLSLTGS